MIAEQKTFIFLLCLSFIMYLPVTEKLNTGRAVLFCFFLASKGIVFRDF